MKKIIASIGAFMPMIALAQTAVITDANSLTRKLVDIGNIVIYVLIAFAVIYIIINVVKFIMAGADDRKEIRMSIIWGIAGLAVILSIWGLVNIFTNTFRTTPPTTTIPQISNYNLPTIH
jgi:RsiW-degrading membrane proteinase PrsW (M82 family)